MTDDDLIIRLQQLVVEGEYLDELYGRPGENLGGATAVRLDGAAMALPTDLSNGRRCYTRGSITYETAKSAGLIDPLPPLRRATHDAIAAAEQEIGLPLPSLLTRLYLEIGNGGFGPGYGILGVAGGFTDDLKHDVVGAYRSFSSSRRDAPPFFLLPLCHWGCAIYSLVELSPVEGRMWGFDPNGADQDHALYCQELSLSDWLQRWIDGQLFQPAVIEDPATGEWRAATDSEMAEWAAELDD